MMRSLYSGVAGLKTHQTKMDVIGNNIANVNTVAFKSTSVTFNEIMYQTTQGASGPNASTGTGGINAKQIGLGVAMASTMTNIKQAGATQTTGGAFDIKINGNSFFVVSDGTSNMFTRAGSFYVDAAGNLAMTSTGYNVMGWQVDPTTGEIKKDTVSPLRIMQAGNMTSAPEATKQATVTGVLDSNSKATTTDSGYITNLNFYDALGYAYTAKFKTINALDESGNIIKGKYKVALTDILDSNSKSVLTSTVTAGNLFGTAEQAKDTGTLLAGRTEKRVTFDSYAGTKKPDGGIDAYAGEYSVIDETGNDIKDTVPMTGLTVSYLVDSTGTEIEGSQVYKDKDGHMYAQKFERDADGKITKATFISLNNTSGENASIIAESKNYYREYFKNNYAGVDPDIYIDGNSTWKDASVYTDTLTLNGITYTTENGYRFKKDGDKYTLYDKSNNPVTDAQDIDIATDDGKSKLFNILKNPNYFKTSAEENRINADSKNDAAVKAMTLTQSKFNTVELQGMSYYSELEFSKDDGTFIGIGKAPSITLALANLGGNFENIEIDYTQVTNYNNGGSSTMTIDRGAKDGSTDAGKKLGAMTGVSIDTNGMIYGSYDNGNTVLLGQIAVANFANASGLEKVGENCYKTTLNSGEFDGIGVDITADGGSMTTGALEMSNVDLSNEFTDMITTQRGFQANSRIITTSDTLLEELINLKR